MRVNSTKRMESSLSIEGDLGGSSVVDCMDLIFLKSIGKLYPLS